MTDQRLKSRIIRTLLGFVAAPLLPSVLYAYLNFGAKAFFPFFYFVLIVAYFLVLLVAVPTYLVLLRKGLLRLHHLTLTSFCVFAILFFFIFLSFDVSSTKLVSGSDVLVSNGEVTRAGYVALLGSSVMMGVMGAMGAFILWLIGPKEKNNQWGS